MPLCPSSGPPSWAVGLSGGIGYTSEMINIERRRADRHPMDHAGTLHLAGGCSVQIRIRNLGRAGALVQLPPIAEAVKAGDRAVLDHPLLGEGEGRSVTCGSIVRVEPPLEGDGVARELAIYFDGGAAPDAYEG
jgi:hypothetical protein